MKRLARPIQFILRQAGQTLTVAPLSPARDNATTPDRESRPWTGAFAFGSPRGAKTYLHPDVSHRATEAQRSECSEADGAQNEWPSHAYGAWSAHFRTASQMELPT